MNMQLTELVLDDVNRIYVFDITQFYIQIEGPKGNCQASLAVQPVVSNIQRTDVESGNTKLLYQPKKIIESAETKIQTEEDPIYLKQKQEMELK